MTSILITGAAGFVGQELAAGFAAFSNITITLTDIVEPPVPQVDQKGQNVNFKCLASDLTQPSAVASLLKDRFDAVYTLHGIMSGGAEANLELGLKVNLDSQRVFLDYLRNNHPGTVVVFASSCAVYGPTSPGEVVTEMTLPLPQSSYGTEKYMIEALLNDYSRRGLLDGRIVRLPTVTVRAGAPTAATSSFASGIIREPLRGQESILPVNPELEVWITSPATLVKNLIAIKDVPKEKFGPFRTVNLPGILVTVNEMLEALEQVGGKEKRALVKEQRDSATEKIVYSWPVHFDCKRATDLGLSADVPFLETVKVFARKEGLI